MYFSFFSQTSEKIKLAHLRAIAGFLAVTKAISDLRDSKYKQAGISFAVATALFYPEIKSAYDFGATIASSRFVY